MAAKSKRPSTRRLAGFRRILKQHMPELSERYKVKSLGIFGSYVRGAHKQRSDLDVLIEFAETPDIFQFMDLEKYLQDLLGVKIDLVSRQALKGRIGQRIMREVIPV